MIQDIQYVITGTNISHDGDTISAPSVTGNSNTLNGVTSTWTNLDIDNKPKLHDNHTRRSVSIHRKIILDQVSRRKQ